MKNSLYAFAIRFDSVSYVHLIHSDARMALRIIERFFGRSFSIRMIVITITPILIMTPIFTMLLTFENTPTREGDIREAISILAILLVFKIAYDQASLFTTRAILARMKPTAASLLKWFAIDLVIAWMAIPLVWYIIQSHSLTMRTVVILLDPGTIYGYDIGNPWQVSVMHWTIRLGVPMIFLGNALPTLLHITLILRDLFIKLIGRPAAIVLSGLLESLSEHERPLTAIFSAIGVIPVLIKLWLDVIAG